MAEGQSSSASTYDIMYTAHAHVFNISVRQSSRLTIMSLLRLFQTAASQQITSIGPENRDSGGGDASSTPYLEEPILRAQSEASSSTG